MRSQGSPIQQLIVAADGEFTFDAELQAQLGAILQSAVTRAHRAVLELVDPVSRQPLVAMERYATPILAGLGAQYDHFLAVRQVSLLALRKQQPVLISDMATLMARSRTRKRTEREAQEGQAASILSVPLVIDGAQVGVLSIASVQPKAFGDQERQDLMSYAAIAAALLKKHRGVDHARSATLGVIRALVESIEVKLPGIRQHLVHVEESAVLIAARLRLSLAEIQTLRRAAWLHDVGKVGIRDRILLADRRLHPREYDEIKKYPLLGAGIVAHVAELADVVPVVKHHHEHWDGSGYPDGLSGEDIPLLSRVLLVAEAFDAMTSERPYRRARSMRTALREIQKESARQFCPRAAHAFFETMREGTLVQDGSLSDIILSHF